MDMPDIIYPPVPMGSADLAIVLAQTSPGTKVHLDLPYNFNNKQGNPKLGWGFRIYYSSSCQCYFFEWDLHEHDTCQCPFKVVDGLLYTGHRLEQSIGPVMETKTWERLLKIAVQGHVLKDFNTALGNYDYFRDRWPEAMEELKELLRSKLETALKTE